MVKGSGPMARREFVKTSVAATGSLLFVKPQTAFSSSANTELRLGLLGCGGRGNSVAQAFVQHTNTRLTAMGDLFDDRFEYTKKKFGDLQKEKGKISVFKGSKAYLEIANSDVDVIIIATPPFFHPEHLEAVLKGGKHAYCEKPVATDVRGCLKVAGLARKVKGRVSVDVGFQMRNGPLFAELTRRIHEGAIGDVALAQGFYFSSSAKPRAKPGMSKLEARIRDWFFDRALSGDIILEQNVHIIDVFNWVLKAHPLRATATGGRKVRTNLGDVWDNYIVTFYYPNDIHASFMSSQFLPEWGDPGYRFFGKKGFCEAFFTGGLRIKGINPWEAGADQAPPGTKPEVDPLKNATPEKVKAFVKSIRSGQHHNQLGFATDSCLSAILGREAAYDGTEMTWRQVVESDQHWDTHIDLDYL